MTIVSKMLKYLFMLDQFSPKFARLSSSIASYVSVFSWPSYDLSVHLTIIEYQPSMQGSLLLIGHLSSNGILQGFLLRTNTKTTCVMKRLECMFDIY